jgi:hypothetical protein
VLRNMSTLVPSVRVWESLHQEIYICRLGRLADAGPPATPDLLISQATAHLQLFHTSSSTP